MNNDSAKIIESLNKELSQAFSDYKGAYFFGSRLSGGYTPESDYDVVLIFDELDYSKRLKIAGKIADFEYKNEVYIDCKLMTSEGESSIDYVRKYINPVFIQNAVDLGQYYAKI